MQIQNLQAKNKIENEDESKQNKKRIESLGFEHLPVEERRTEENLHRFVHGNVSKALWKHFDSIFLHGNVFFYPK